MIAMPDPAIDIIDDKLDAIEQAQTVHHNHKATR